MKMNKFLQLLTRTYRVITQALKIWRIDWKLVSGTLMLMLTSNTSNAQALQADIWMRILRILI
jgi:hypothetical protein